MSLAVSTVAAEVMAGILRSSPLVLYVSVSYVAFLFYFQCKHIIISVDPTAASHWLLSHYPHSNP
jgi:hypothetical protein